MGEVYRALDTRLQRIVAVKILPADLSSNPEAKQRFEREARAISSLNHPHICTLYDVGHQDGTDYLVMEFLEGETLAERLGKGPLPLQQVLKCGAEIGEGLERAHRTGVVHRDLKPGNIMLTKSGAKLMDFGLAKQAISPPSSGLSMTLTSPVDASPLTTKGTIVGTFQYMSPEQIEGKEADFRSDIFAFGAILYEMVTGKRAFEGKTTASTIAAILASEPQPIASIQPMLPPALEHVIKICLAKDPEDRFQTVHDLKMQLEWIAEVGSRAGGPAPVASHRKLRQRAAWAAAGIFALTTVALTMVSLHHAPAPPQTMHLRSEIGADAGLNTELGTSVILSPDTTRMAFVASGSDQQLRLYVRSLDQLSATALSGTDNAQNPFFSPDGQWLGFFADGKLKKISVQGIAAVNICDAVSGRGGSWGEDGTIVFTPDIRAALFKVSSSGGTAQPLTTLDQQAGEVTQRWPQVLPGGNAVLFTSNTHGGNYEDADIVVYSISSGRRKTVQHGGFFARYMATGHIVYMHDGTLFALPFDLKRLEVTGQPVPILGGVLAVPGDASAQVSFSQGGNLLYVAGHVELRTASIYWRDSEGKFTPLRQTPADYNNPVFSPDGKRLALEINDGKETDIWVYEWERDVLTRLTFGGGDKREDNTNPIWTADGKRITYSSDEKSGASDLYWTRADGGGDTRRLTETRNKKSPSSWTPDGKVLTFNQLKSGTTWNTMTMTTEGNEMLGWKLGEPKPFLDSASREDMSVFSPDGRWLAYQSNESGEFQVYVQPFPGPGGRWQVSTDGGRFPKWSRNRRELFYLTQDNKIEVATYTASNGSFRSDKPRLWSPGQFTERNFDLHPDGTRFAVLKASANNQSPPINKVSFILNFFEELRRKVAAQK
jgi:eukaryotic-like serine/threonine-protein kinase